MPPFSSPSTFRRQQESPYPKNEQIRAPEVRLIGIDGKQIGVIPTKEALQKAQEAELDLVVISPTAQPPVAKIIDYGQFLYQKQKEEQHNKAKQKKSELKTLKLSLKTSEHDQTRMVEKALKFLADGDKVRFEMRLRGREKFKKELAKQIMNEVLQKISSSAKVEQPVTALDTAVVFTLTAKK